MCDASRQPARDSDTQAISLDSDGSGEIRVLKGPHNWCEVIASYPVTVTAGDVQVFRLEANPDNTVVVKALIGVLAFNADGAGSVFHVAPGSRLAFSLSGYAGAGEVTGILSSWSEA